MNKVNSTVISLFAIAAALSCGCSRVAPVAGGSSQQGNGMVVGSVVDSSGSSVARVRVALLPALYDPVKDTNALPTDTTDSLGHYDFSKVDTGDYVVEAMNGKDKTRFIHRGIHIMGDTIVTPPDTLRLPGTVKVSLPAGMNGAMAYFYIPGTTHFVFLNNRVDFAVLDSVPAGLIPEISYSSTNSTVATAIRYNVPVATGDTSVVTNPSWKYARTIGLNTSATGAGVSAAVMHFPVFIRLNAGNFDFSQAREGGADLMFTKSNNEALPYEIERWDPAAERAEVWVKIDTVFGSDSDQSITMYWGASTGSASSLSNGEAVFDTADGFQGVWHLGDNSDDSVRDATANRYHGVSPDSARPSITEGITGNCREFDGRSDFITMPNTAASKLNLRQDGNYSVSAWVSADTFISQQQTLVSKGRYQYFLWIDSTSWAFWEYQDRAGWETSAQKATLRQWVLLTAVRDGAGQYLYVNGISVDNIRLIPDTAPRNTGSDLNVGQAHELATTVKEYASLCYFRGKIDEIRISSVSRSSDWIKLCYMNQRVDDKLTVFK